MASDCEAPTPDEAAHSLATLSADSDRLVANVKAPWLLLAAFGGIGAWWVSAAAGTTPGANYEAPSSTWLLVICALIVMYLTQRTTGVRFRKMGSGATWAVVGMVVICLALFSLSLGLTALGMRWAVALTSLAAFGATTWLAGVAYTSAVGALRDE